MLMFLALLAAASFGGCIGFLIGAAMARGKIIDLEAENVAQPGQSIPGSGGRP
ncbi:MULTISPECIES: hypothetical protein [unclassified Bradyrhizobium]|uniref:hypothetical protein n=1 Tax=unclassified Bradyrhizobium TaxID=2631580 RepID=UPI002915DD30|nr:MULTISPECIES: hypothetical protein [unclassified Bradyrhizobium]